jgi:hypothetical protein
MHDSVHAISVEITRPPRLAYIEDPAEVPLVPDVPTVFAIDEYHAYRESPHALDQLRKVFAALIHDQPMIGVIAVYEPKGFERAYHQLLGGTRSKQPASILLYLPHRGGTPAKLPRALLVQTRAMLERFEYRLPSRVEPEDSATAGRLKAARQRRAQLLEQEHWLNGSDVHQQQGGDPDAPGANNTASRLRRKRELLGAWGGREYLHPSFQFDRKTGRLMPETKSLLETLPRDASGWRQIFWLFQPHAALDGNRPADVFQRDPQAVIEAARGTFTPGDTNW